MNWHPSEGQSSRNSASDLEIPAVSIHRHIFRGFCVFYLICFIDSERHDKLFRLELTYPHFRRSGCRLRHPPHSWSKVLKLSCQNGSSAPNPSQQEESRNDLESLINTYHFGHNCYQVQRVWDRVCRCTRSLSVTSVRACNQPHPHTYLSLVCKYQPIFHRLEVQMGEDRCPWGQQIELSDENIWIKG